MNLSRRRFLFGTAAVAAAIPLAPLLELAPTRYEGYIGVYEGVVIREVASLDPAASLTMADIIRAKEFAKAASRRFEPDRNGCYHFAVHPSIERSLRRFA